MLEMQIFRTDVMLLALAFAVVSSNFLYKVMHGIAGRFAPFVDGAGRPTVVGTLAHTAVFAIVAAYILSRVRGF